MHKSVKNVNMHKSVKYGNMQKVIYIYNLIYCLHFLKYDALNTNHILGKKCFKGKKSINGKIILYVAP